MITTQTEAASGLLVLRGRVDSLSLYEITEHELHALEEGSPSSIHLNFAVFFISTAISFLITLNSAVVTGNAFIVFVVITVAGFSMGTVLMFLWYKSHRQLKDLIKKIKQRTQITQTQACVVTTESSVTRS